MLVNVQSHLYEDIRQNMRVTIHNNADQTFWIFDTKVRKDWSKRKHSKHLKTNIQKWSKHAIHVTNKVVCAIHKWHQIKIDKLSTHHIWDSRNCTNANGLMEWFKPWTIKRFGEDVRLLVVRMYEFKAHDFIFHQISDEVITNLYVVGLWMLNRILGKIYSTSVVTKHTHHFLRNPIVMK